MIHLTSTRLWLSGLMLPLWDRLTQIWWLTKKGPSRLHWSDENGLLRGTAHLALELSWFCMKGWKQPLLGKTLASCITEAKPLAQGGPWFTSIPVDTWAWFTDASARVKADGIHCAAVAVQPQSQLQSTDGGCDHLLNPQSSHQYSPWLTLYLYLLLA